MEEKRGKGKRTEVGRKETSLVGRPGEKIDACFRLLRKKKGVQRLIPKKLLHPYVGGNGKEKKRKQESGGIFLCWWVQKKRLRRSGEPR